VSDISDAAKACVILTDYSSQDASGKMNMLGANWGTTVITPTGMTPPQTVVVMIDVPARFYGQSFAFSLALNDEVGAPVELPGQSGALRVAQVVPVERPAVPGAILPDDLPAKLQIAMSFPTGLPLQAGRTYSWQLQIDGNTRPEWSTVFYVLGPRPAPVVG
jgi:hypothetical protein